MGLLFVGRRFDFGFVHRFGFVFDRRLRFFLGEDPMPVLVVGDLRRRGAMVGWVEEGRRDHAGSDAGGGATDGRPIHMHGIGVPAVYIGVPTRYIHSHAGVFHADDYDNAVKLLVEAVKRLDAKAVESFYP